MLALQGKSITRVTAGENFTLAISEKVQTHLQTFLTDEIKMETFENDI